MMQSTDIEWRVHLGAHKTASTHLTTLFKITSDELARKGVTYIPHAKFVRQYLGSYSQSRPVSLASRLIPKATSILVERHCRRARTKILSVAPLPGVILTSDENLLGPLSSCLSGRLYPNLLRLELLRRVVGGDKAKLFLAIRSFDSYLPSVYAQQLRLSAIDRRALENAATAFAKSLPRWIDLIHRIRKILPDAPLHVWDYADYRRNDWRIADRVSGVSIGPRESIPAPPSTASPSTQAIITAETLDMPSSRERTRRVREMFVKDIENGGQREQFDPLPVKVKAIFRDAFQRDLDEIDRLFPGMRLVCGK